MKEYNKDKVLRLFQDFKWIQKKKRNIKRMKERKKRNEVIHNHKAALKIKRKKINLIRKRKAKEDIVPQVLMILSILKLLEDLFSCKWQNNQFTLKGQIID